MTTEEVLAWCKDNKMEVATANDLIQWVNDNPKDETDCIVALGSSWAGPDGHRGFLEAGCGGERRFVGGVWHHPRGDWGDSWWFLAFVSIRTPDTPETSLSPDTLELRVKSLEERLDKLCKI